MTSGGANSVSGGGGVSVGGSVSTGGGDVVGRDKIVNYFHADVDTVRQMVAVLEGAKASLTATAPKQSLDALEAVLGEISKIYGVIESELVRYLSLSFGPGVDVLSERGSLLMMEGGKIEARAHEMRGHCHKIGAIYCTALRDWFQQTLLPGDALVVSDAFARLRTGDDGMVAGVEELARWLSTRASETLDRVDAGDLEAAGQQVREARRIALPLRRAMADTLREMRDLDAELIAALDK
jgi:hypothetical protein